MYMSIGEHRTDDRRMEQVDARAACRERAPTLSSQLCRRVVPHTLNDIGHHGRDALGPPSLVTPGARAPHDARHEVTGT